MKRERFFADEFADEARRWRALHFASESTDRIAIGQFSLCKDIRVFDFTAFTRSRRKDNPEIYSHTRYDFISHMEEEISKPILPYERQREFIATQIVAEYLREYFGCDAVIYRSAMHKGSEIENRNIVIFGAPEDFPGGEVVRSYLSFGTRLRR